MQYSTYILRLLIPALIFLTLPVLGQQPKRTGPEDVRSYIPYQPEYFPVKRVRLVIHVFGKDDGSGNLPDNAEGCAHIDRMVNHMNWHYADVDELNPPSPDSNYVHIRDSRIRMVVDTILFHRNTEAWNFRKHTAYKDPYGKDSAFNEGIAYTRSELLYGQFVTKNPQMPQRLKDSALHIFLLEADRFQNRGMAQSLFTNRWVYCIGAYHYFKADPKPDHWTVGLLMAHEVGHALGLTHPYDYHGISDLPQTPRGATNNVMDCWPKQGRAMTPMQIGIIHRGLSGHNGQMHRILIPDWRTARPDSVIYIPAGDTVWFSGDRFLGGNISLDPGAVLVVQGKLVLPEDARIHIGRKASLILDGGTIGTDTDKKWAGITTAKSGRFLFFGGKPSGFLELKNGGKLVNVRE